MSRRIGLSLFSILLTPAGVLWPASSYLAYSRPFAKVSLGGTSQNKEAIYGSNDSVQFTVQVVTTADVPNTATAKVDFLDDNNPGSVRYAISPRTQTKTLRGGGQSTAFTFTMTTNGEKLSAGTVTFQFSLDSATGATVTEPQTADVSVIVQSAGGVAAGFGNGDAKIDQNDAVFALRAKVDFSLPGTFSRRWAVDVFLMKE